MIGPAILRGRLIKTFREHLLNFDYNHIINDGDRVVNYEIKNLNEDEELISNVLIKIKQYRYNILYL